MWILFLACQPPSPEDSVRNNSVFDSEIEEDSGSDIFGDWPPPPVQTPLPIVIIGAGPAGLAAAMDLPQSILLEADSEVGGRFRWAGGLMLLVGTEEQAAVGVNDSPELAAAEWPTITGSEATEVTMRYLKASDAVRDRLTDLGVHYLLSPPGDWLGTSRVHQPVGDGIAVVQALADGLPETVDLRLNTAATGIVLEGERVVGVQTADSLIPANTVILASGGFVNRMEIVQTLHSYPDGSWMVGSEGGATGFAYDQALALGLPTASLSAIGWFARSIGVGGPDGRPIPFSGQGQIPWVTVDETGSRMVDENRTGSVTTSGILSAHTNVWSLTTWELLQKGVPPDALPFLEAADPGQFVCGESWADLADKTQIHELDTVISLVTSYRNGSAMDPLQRPGNGFPDLSGTPCAFRPGHEAAKNFGGLLVDADGRVPGVKGLWAIGEAAGMAVPGIGGAWGYDGSSGAVIWSGWRTAAAVWGRDWP